MRKSFHLAVFFVMRLGAVCFLRGRGMFKIHLGKRGGLGRFLQLGGPQMCIDSVSYTHLRAHETGRNLVCRLLLEKKKTKKIKQK